MLFEVLTNLLTISTIILQIKPSLDNVALKYERLRGERGRKVTASEDNADVVIL
jgi:hypothetical protein